MAEACLDQGGFEAAVARATLAPSVHNVQPARFSKVGDTILVGCDETVGLAVGDPTARDAGLSCGAAVEALILALSARGIATRVEDCWDQEDRHSLRRHRLAARITCDPDGAEDGLHAQLEQRFTWRGMFGAGAELYGWSRSDAVLITDGPRRDWLADLNDAVSLEIMGNRAFRRELVGWMRLRSTHPRYRYDGLSRDAMGMSGAEALAAPLALGPFWGLLGALGQTKGLVAEADATRSAPVIACFHRPASESPVTSGRAYLRMCLEAANLGFAGWPMAALSDHDRSNAEICARIGLPPEDRLVQVIRFGAPTGTAPPRARRPLDEVIVTP